MGPDQFERVDPHSIDEPLTGYASPSVNCLNVSYQSDAPLSRAYRHGLPRKAHVSANLRPCHTLPRPYVSFTTLITFGPITTLLSGELKTFTVLKELHLSRGAIVYSRATPPFTESAEASQVIVYRSSPIAYRYSYAPNGGINQISSYIQVSDFAGCYPKDGYLSLHSKLTQLTGH